MVSPNARHSGKACAGLDPVAGVQDIEARLDSGFSILRSSATAEDGRRNDKKGKGWVYFAERQVSFLFKLAASAASGEADY
jgi:hypothetical protein